MLLEAASREYFVSMDLRNVICSIGGVLLGLGLLCLPLGFGANPERDTSAFFRAADTGIWLKLAIALILAGATVLLASPLLRRRR